MSDSDGDDPSTASTSLLDHRRTPEERAQMIALLARAASAAGESAADAPLTRESEVTVRTADGRALPDFTPEDEERATLPFSSFAVDVDERVFFFSGRDGYKGPVSLPDGFHYPALLPSTPRDPTATSPGEKVLKQLTSVVNAQEPRVYGTPYTEMRLDEDKGAWRTPSGDALHRADPKDARFALGTRGFLFDLPGKRFWIEEGAPGRCKGPYKLPHGFQLGNVSALDSVGGP